MEGMPPTGYPGVPTQTQPPYPYPQYPVPPGGKQWGYGGGFEPALLAGAAAGAVGAVLVLVCSFTSWESAGGYGSETKFQPEMLFLGLALLASLAAALFWRENSAGALSSLIFSVAALFISSMVCVSRGGDSTAGAASYLASIGSVLAVTGSVILFARREA